MQALDLRDNSLQWETERQNRIHQSAIEQKKKQVRFEAVQRESPYTQSVPVVAAISLEDWVDKLQRIPDMRSALIPFDESDEGWSKPFSLAKADIEPWLSYYRGYRLSRLFLDSSAPGGATAADLDYPVRALLDLRQISASLIIEPPVQINGPVEYIDLEDVVAGNLDQVQLRRKLVDAERAHGELLKFAADKGREMGDLLHEALMGEGHVNLIAAWQKVHRRKPTVEELHRMLTTGRIALSMEKPTVQPEIRQRPIEMPAVSAAARPVQEKALEMPQPKSQPRETVAPAASDDDEPVVSLSSKNSAPNHKRKALLYVFHATACCAALAFYFLAL